MQHTQPITIRAERPGEEATVRAVLLDAFETHGDAIASLVASLRESPTAQPSTGWLAWSGAEAIGYVRLSRCWLDAPARLVDVLTLSPLAVLARHQGRGIGSALLRHAVRAADHDEWPLVFLEGDPGYYARRGFEPATPLGFRAPSSRIPAPAFQVARLTAHRSWMTGTLVHPDVFWQHDCVGLRRPDAIAG